MSNSERQNLKRDGDEDQSLAQIREIVVGAHRRQTEQQFEAIEEKLKAQDAALRQLLEQRFQSAMDDLNGAMETLGDRQRAAVDELGEDMQGQFAKTEDRAVQLESELRDLTSELRRRFEDQATELQRLEEGSVDRAGLADLLEAMALQLRTGGT